jgi:disulfide bond formation protein DsbB
LLGELEAPGLRRDEASLAIDRQSRIDRWVGGSGGASAPHTPRLVTRFGTPYSAAMSVEAVQVFAALLAIGAAALAAFVVVVGRLARGRSALLEEVMVAIDDAALWIAFLVAALATAGSLYFSEVANYVPCRLCWFQRIAMYPLAVILLVAAIRRDRLVRWYAIPLAGLGAGVSIYHYLIEWHPQLEGDACDPTNPCSLVWFREFGFATLALMALCGFAAIVALLLPPRRRELEGVPDRLGS